jgi:hypothetical protein
MPLKRFAVALSFPGEWRARVEAIAATLAKRVGRDRILYDRYHEAEFARPNLDLHLPALYHDETELNVVFLCKEYGEKEWCGLEWRAIRDLIKQRREDIMLLRFDDATVQGVYGIDGYIDIKDRTTQDVATRILERHAQHNPEGQKPLLHDTGKLADGHTQMCDLLLEKGERINVQLEAEHEIDFAICTPPVYKRWRNSAKLTGCLHLARRTSNMAITLIAKETGKHHVLIINNTRRKKPVKYTLAIQEPPTTMPPRPTLPASNTDQGNERAPLSAPKGGRAVVLYRQGDIFEVGSDLTVLPCSARGHFSHTAKAHIERFGLPLPPHQSLGSITVYPFPGDGTITRFIAWAASVMAYQSTAEIIKSIGQHLGSYANANTHIHFIEAPLLGTGSGDLDELIAGPALREGFLTTCTTDATLIIYAQPAGLIRRLRASVSDLDAASNAEPASAAHKRRPALRK